jgi:hypothetical protein
VGVPFVPQEVFVGSVVAWVENITPQVRIQEIPVQRKYDNLSNHIAQDWPYSSGGADDDNDNTPAGDGTVGDGLSRYEEYRGLLLAEEDWKLTRLNPNEKNMFVQDNDPDTLGTVEYFPGAGMPDPDRFDYSWGRTFMGVMNYKSSSHQLAEVWPVNIADRPVPGDPDAWGSTYGPYFQPGCLIYINVALIQEQAGDRWHQFRNEIIGHELGHTVLWHRPDGGDHEVENPQDCLMAPEADPDWPVYAKEFCAVMPGTENDPGCQFLWHFTRP